MAENMQTVELTQLEADALIELRAGVTQAQRAFSIALTQTFNARGIEKPDIKGMDLWERKVMFVEHAGPDT